MALFLAGSIVMLAALYLLGFGAVAVIVPARASGYLHGFAKSARVHAFELMLRAAVGIAFLGYASQMNFSGAFRFFGLILLITTLGMAVLPWSVHQRFARTSVPAVRPYLRLVGIVSIAAGAFVFWAVAHAIVA